MRVIHVITGLDVGGAESMLERLVLAPAPIEHQVISLTGVGSIGERLRSAGVSVRALDLAGSSSGSVGRRAVAVPVALARLARWVREARPAVVQTWLAHADLLGGVATRLSAVAPVVWGVRQSNLAVSRSTQIVLGGHRQLARLVPARIICNSLAGFAHLEASGYPTGRIAVIPNGFDTNRFRPDGEARRSVRAEWGIEPDCLVVGLVARFDPNKGHDTFVQAAELIARAVPEARFVLCGAGVDPGNAGLRAALALSGVDGATRLLGLRNDIERVTNGFDVAVSASTSEGFSSSLGEAMACGIPCVATDAGDARPMLAGFGRVVPSGTPEALADAVVATIELAPDERRAIGDRSRDRVVAGWSMPAIADRYHRLYQEICQEAAARVRTRRVA